MPERCVVYGCSNTTNTRDGIFLYQIPFWDDTSAVAEKTKENMGAVHSTQKRQMDANTLIGYML